MFIKGRGQKSIRQFACFSSTGNSTIKSRKPKPQNLKNTIQNHFGIQQNIQV